MNAPRYPADLPITARRGDILAALARHQVLILAGETGSGKTTQLPKMCLEALGGRPGKIGCTQPRRVAAMSVSRRVAEELGVVWGREVGCKMRFNDDTNRETRVKFMTDGILLAEIQSDPLLRGYAFLILDEAHERSLNIDFLLGHLQRILPRRPDLRLVVTSATIDTDAFSRAFGGAPVIEVSGRVFPVEIRHVPVSAYSAAGDDDDPSHIEAAVAAVEEVLLESSGGDTLVFMPTERDIRETRDLLQGRLGPGTDVLALFGRMPAAEQQKVFQPGPARRVIVATNVAETSVTIPRIRFVIDTGLARVSRYNPRTRVKRLPVEEISQSSANQRAGRAGRVQDGTCIRLYDEANFAKRDRFTVPEIQRANLAEVILRMKAFNLGDIATFPFIDPPSPAAIKSGHALLHELGSLDEREDLTPLGRDLARLPVDPTLGRMLLQASREKVLPEMLVIAAGLSVPDPRERPEEEKEKAAAAHKTFHSPQSDFLSLLKIWRAMPDASAQGISRQSMRKFCKAHYLSLVRMREWRDIWRQLRDAFPDDPGARGDDLARTRAPDEDAIHRCILAGHLSHIGRREESNLYKTAGNRMVSLFPGSHLHERREKKPATPQKPGDKPKSRQPEWIVAGEIVQTSRLFARTVAGIDPLWVVDIGAHLCKFRYSEPHWNARAGRVLCLERTLVHGLEIRQQRVDHGKINMVEATELFIRGALLDKDSGITQRFHAHNHRLVQKITAALSRVRSNRLYAIEDALFNFYAARLTGISSVHDLNKLVASRHATEPDFLHASEDDLLGQDELSGDLAAFPDAVELANNVLPVSYAYSPGNDDDGVTLRVPLPVAASLSTSQVQWMVPGLREEMLRSLLRGLPKTIRKRLLPIEARATELAATFTPGHGDFLHTLAAHLRSRYGLDVTAADFAPSSLPVHLQPRVEIIDQNQKVLAAGRDIHALRASVQRNEVRTSNWDAVTARFARPALATWSFGDQPESVIVEKSGDAVTLGFPGLAATANGVDLRLFRTASEADQSTPAGIRKLAENLLAKDIAWLTKEMKSLRPPSGKSPAATKPRGFDALHALALAPARPANAAPSAPADMASQAVEHILAHALRLDPPRPLQEARFKSLCTDAVRAFPVLAHRVRTLVAEIEAARLAYLAAENRHPGWDEDLARLVPPDLLAQVPHHWLAHIPRFLKAMAIRSERASLQPAKDREKAALLVPWTSALPDVPAHHRDTFRWMLEEFRVSLFAQELGTSIPVSPKRLEKLLHANPQ